MPSDLRCPEGEEKGREVVEVEEDMEEEGGCTERSGSLLSVVSIEDFAGGAKGERDEREEFGKGSSKPPEEEIEGEDGTGSGTGATCLC